MERVYINIRESPSQIDWVRCPDRPSFLVSTKRHSCLSSTVAVFESLSASPNVENIQLNLKDEHL